jgi:DNA-binding transcriptional MerR regulator
MLMVKSARGIGLRSGSLAKATGLSADTIRHYERIGVLPKAVRTESGYRVYPESALARVQIVQRALGIGFTLAELADVLKARDAGRSPCRRVHQIATEKLKGIKTDIQALRRLEKYLKSVLADWENRMRDAGPGKQSHLLYSLGEGVKRSGKATTRFPRKGKS